VAKWLEIPLSEVEIPVPLILFFYEMLVSDDTEPVLAVVNGF
jgi:hypothetical protein